MSIENKSPIDSIDCHLEKTCLSQHTLEAQTEMRSNDMLCDACIVLDDGSTIRVHRIILCASCEYFKALFTSTLNQTERKEVHVAGISSNVMEAIVEFAYSRYTKIDKANVIELVTAAHYFGLNRLVDLSADFITKMLKPENCIYLWLEVRANLYQHDLDTLVKAYVLRHFNEIATKSQEILQISFEIFFEIIKDDMLNVKDEEPVWECCLRWVDYDVDYRKQFVPKLLSGCRLGLMNLHYFVEKVKDHPYVRQNIGARDIIVETLTFMYDLNTISIQEESFRTPRLAFPRLPHDIIFTIGGWAHGRARTIIEVYDTRADRWICLDEEDPFGARAYHGTAAVGTKIYCIGGYDGLEHFNKCTVFNAVDKTWKEIAPMHSRRCYVSVVELNGKIYAMGGHDGIQRLNSVERYDPMTNQWTMMAAMSTDRSDSSCTALNGKVYAIGGFNGTQCLSSGEVYDPEINQWTAIASMHFRRSGLASIAQNGFIYTMGGFNGTLRLSSSERYDPVANQWNLAKPMNSPRSNFAIEKIDDMIYVVGGFDGKSTITLTECYNPANDEWLEATNTCHARSALSASVISGLPNVQSYTYANREFLLEERRLFNKGKISLNW